MTAQRRVFAWAEGQATNLGDSVLRRGLLRRLPLEGAHVYVGGCSDQYLSAVPLPRSVVRYRSQLAWHLAAIASALVRPTHVVMSAGEAIADRRSLGMRLAFVVSASLTRRRGGGVHQTGVGVRRPLGRLVAPLRWSVRRAATVTWRDRWSRDAMGVGEVSPDWAFGEGSPAVALASVGRDALTIALRGDREPASDAWTTFLRDYADSRGLRLVVVSQVEADTAAAGALAERLGAELVAPTDESHAEQERRLREVYRRTELILSDRLHGLVIALTEGALPIAGGPSSAEKSRRTLEAAGVPFASLDKDHVEGAAPTAQQELDRLRGRRAEFAEALEASRIALDAVASRLVASIEGTRGHDAR